jgi:dihydrolipoamide dehydrogenase
MSKRYDVAVIGAGYAGISAAREAREDTASVALIDGGEPAGHRGSTGGLSSRLPLERVAQGRRTGPLQATGAELLRGRAELLDPGTLQVGGQRITARAVVVATGARSRVPPAWRGLGRHLITVEDLLRLDRLPESLAVVGLGPVGIELAQSLRRLGVAVTGIESGDGVAGISDPVVNRAALDAFSRELPLRLGETPGLRRYRGGLVVQLAEHSVAVDKVLVAVGRRPNVAGLGLERLGVPLDPHGVPHFDPTTMQVGGLPVYLAGGVTGCADTPQRAADQGSVAGFNAARRFPTAFKPKTDISVVFSDPPVVAVGRRFAELDGDAVAIGQARFDPPAARSLPGRTRGVVRVYGDKMSGRLLGACMIGAGCEPLGHLVAWAVESGMTAAEALTMPYHYPVLQEALEEAVQDLARRVPGGDLAMSRFRRLPPAYPRPVHLG